MPRKEVRDSRRDKLINAACGANDVEQLRYLLGKYGSRSVSSEKHAKRDTAVHVAAQRGSVACLVEILTIDPSLVNKRGSENRSPLHHAAVGTGEDSGRRRKKGRTGGEATSGDTIGAVRCLLAKGAAVDCQERHGYTPLMLAIKEGRERIAEELVRSGANVALKDKRSFTALHHAVKNMGTSTIALLLRAGADVDARARSKATPLMVALEYGSDTDQVRALIDAGADVNTRNRMKQTPLHLVSSLKCTKVLLAAGAECNVMSDFGQSPLHAAAEAGSAKRVEALLEAGAQVNLKEEGSYTVLMEAVYSCSRKTVRAVLGAGPDIDAVCNGETALMIAIDYAYFKIATVLMDEGGADPCFTVEGKTTLMFAMQHAGDEDDDDEEAIAMIERLINIEGVDVHARAEENGRNALLELMYQAPTQYIYDSGSSDSDDAAKEPYAGVTKVVHMLLDLGVDVNCVDSDDGNTPLHWAFSSGLWKCCRVLLENGAKAHIVNHEGDAAAAMVDENEVGEIPAELVKLVATVNDGVGKTVKAARR